MYVAEGVRFYSQETLGVVTQTRECSRLIELLEKVRVYKIMIPVIVTYKPIANQYMADMRYFSAHAHLTCK